MSAYTELPEQLKEKVREKNRLRRREARAAAREKRLQDQAKALLRRDSGEQTDRVLTALLRVKAQRRGYYPTEDAQI